MRNNGVYVDEYLGREIYHGYIGYSFTVHSMIKHRSLPSGPEQPRGSCRYVCGLFNHIYSLLRMHADAFEIRKQPFLSMLISLT